MPTDIVNLEAHYIGSPSPGVNLYQVPNAAMQVLADIINATWNEGIATKEEFSDKITAALAGFLMKPSAPFQTTAIFRLIGQCSRRRRWTSSICLRS